MIISASRRTDIPTYYSDWFFNRIKEGFVLVRNPMNIHQISKIDLSVDIVDAIIFWTKNPIPMLERLSELKKYMYYFQFTLNAYENDVEINLPSKNDILIPAFQKLSDKIGADRVIWRYDPILLNAKYTIEYHIKYFEQIAKKLKNYTKKCTISFVDYYKNASANMRDLNSIEISQTNMRLIAKIFAQIASSYGFMLDTCTEFIDLSELDILHAKCIDDRLLERLLNCKLNIAKDKNQRLECGCVESIDIGMYNTCQNGCKYCYANFNNNIVKANISKHNVHSPLLFGEVGQDDRLTVRKAKSLKDSRISFLDD
jgi:hypothetical protein